MIINNEDFKFAFDEKRNPKMDINVLVIKDGKFVELK